MSEKKGKSTITAWERYLAEEIGIEFKACLYFFCILFYYAMYQLAGGHVEANIFHMVEMILTTYAMGYIQLYFLSNFDEGDYLRGKEIIFMILCSLVYTGISFWGGWFDGKVGVSVGFTFYMMLAYVCAFLVYKLKRDIDAKLLNKDLKAFQERNGVRVNENEQCNRD